MILLDTNILSELMKPKPLSTVVDWLDQQNIHEIHTSVITHIEIYQGLATLSEGKRKQSLLSQASTMFEIFEHRLLAINPNTTSHYLTVYLERKKLGRPINLQDALIAAICLEHGLKLITRNVRDFEHISNLKVFNPWDEPI